MIANHVIQADIIADLLAYGTLTALLGSATEIRESSYQGADFAYPAVRLEVVSNTAITNRGENCDHSSLLFIVRAYAEGGSSRVCNVVADAINTRFHRRNFGLSWGLVQQSFEVTGRILGESRHSQYSRVTCRDCSGFRRWFGSFYGRHNLAVLT